jgi:hypothetical protein
MLRRVCATICAIVLLAFSWPASAQKRVALVIGNGAYGKVNKLSNPTRDAIAIETMLKSVGFDVVQMMTDVNSLTMRKALRDFSEHVRGADIAIVYYAGHGIEVNGTNYLIPIDARLERDIDVEDETISLDRVVQLLEHAKLLRLIVLDACRDNPFTSGMKRTIASRSIGRGLAKIEVQVVDTLVAFAAKAGATAADGDGKNSPYTTALVRHLSTPGLDVRLALGRVRDDVLRATKTKQEPFVYGSLGGSEISIVPGGTTPQLIFAPTVSASSLEAIGKKFSVGSRAGNQVAVVEAVGIDGEGAMAVGVQLRDEVIDLCANAKQFNTGTREFKSCIIAELDSRDSDRSMIKANCRLGIVYLSNSKFPFSLPIASRTLKADCNEAGFWETKDPVHTSPIGWQTSMQATSAFKVLCPENSKKWNLLAKKC